MDKHYIFQNTRWIQFNIDVHLYFKCWGSQFIVGVSIVHINDTGKDNTYHCYNSIYVGVK